MIYQRADPTEIESDWRTWLAELFGEYAGSFGDHHALFWEWVWSIEHGSRPRPFVAIWPRGGAKSTSAELASVALGARGRRRYVLYVSATQEQADDHVSNIAALLEAQTVETYYPELASRLVGKFGNPKGWRRNRVRTSAGFTVDAVGLDTAARGIKLEDTRPDLLLFDDLDGVHDTAATVDKRITTITHSLIPAGSLDVAILAIQNLVHPDGVFAQLADNRADFLADRIVSGPIPALRNIATEQRDGRIVIVAGVPTWPGQDLARCQEMVSDMGLTAFMSECQHDVTVPAGGMFDHLQFRHCRRDEVPDLVRVVVWVDPAVTATDKSDSCGIQADGIAADDTIYRLWSWEQISTPRAALRVAIEKAVELKAETVGVETDQGGDLWRDAYYNLAESMDLPYVPAFRSDKAGAGHGPKVHRASLQLAAYERGGFVHVLGTHDLLERALRRFPKSPPFDLVDASYWSFRDLNVADWSVSLVG